MSDPVPFNRPYATGHEFAHIQAAITGGHLSGNGPFTERCATRLQELTGTTRTLLTASCTSALEMACVLADLGPGDEVIMPSFTFVSTASAVALRGAVPVFVDIRPDTLNIDERLVADAITDRTRALMPVHYAGVGCAMESLCALAATNDLIVIEDAAQGILSEHKGRPLGSIGQLGALSFHETKNVICGEGGALLINEPAWIERAEILQEKGTNRSQFFRGQVDKYTWVELGSSFLTSEVAAAFLWAQLEEAQEITRRRMAIWDAYHERFAGLEREGLLQRPVVPADCTHNAHMYRLILPDMAARDAVIAELARRGILAVFHYVPLHSSPAGRRFGRAHGDLSITDDRSDRLVRLPLWVGLGEPEIERVVAGVVAAIGAAVA